MTSIHEETNPALSSVTISIRTKYYNAQVATLNVAFLLLIAYLQVELWSKLNSGSFTGDTVPDIAIEACDCLIIVFDASRVSGIKTKY
jgi:hypothetical protein